MDIILFFITLFFSFGSLIAVFCLTPYFTPSDTCFGVRVPKDCSKTKNLKKIKNNYTLFSAISGIIFALCAFIIKKYGALFSTLICYLLFSLLNYLFCKRTVKSMELSDSADYEKSFFEDYLPSRKGFSVWWELICIIFPVSLFVLTYIFKLSYYVPCLSVLIFLLVFFIHLCIEKFPIYAEDKNFSKSLKTTRRWTGLCIIFAFFLQLLPICLFLKDINFFTSELTSVILPFFIAAVIVVIAIIFGVKK